MEDRLRATQRFAQATLDALNECVGVIDATGTLVEVNDRWRGLDDGAGGTPEAVPLGGNYLLACESTAGYHRGQAGKLAQGIRSVLLGEADRFAMESARESADGLTWMHSRVHRFVVDGTVYAAVSHEDITERRVREQELQDLRTQQWHSERITRTGLLVGSLAHELSQPLTAILSNAQSGLRLLAGNALPPQEIRDILDDIVSDSKRAGEIIESLRMMLLRQRTERKPVDAAEVVLDVIGLLHSEFIRQRVEVEHGCIPGSVVLADRGQIQQVVLNLMINGIDAMLPLPVGQRRLRAAVGRTDEGEVRIEVRDYGVGITQGKLHQVFDGFWTTKSRGMGMGLAICRSIVESHGGRIWVERNGSAGSTFFVALPAGAQRKPAAPATEAAGAPE